MVMQRKLSQLFSRSDCQLEANNSTELSRALSWTWHFGDTYAMRASLLISKALLWAAMYSIGRVSFENTQPRRSLASHNYLSRF